MRTSIKEHSKLLANINKPTKQYKSNSKTEPPVIILVAFFVQLAIFRSPVSVFPAFQFLLE